MGEGEQRFGPFVLLSQLGEGATGSAYLARPASGELGSPPLLVVKTLHPDLAEEERFVHRFRHEAEIATRVRSRHVAEVYDAGTVQGVLYIAMEYVDGWPLSRVLPLLSEAGEVLPIGAVVHLLLDLLAGLAAIHGATGDDGAPLRAIHRDVAPKNIILGRDGFLRLVDLGIGRSRLLEWRTQAGAIIGSVGYMAPEQVAGLPVDLRIDLYAAGAVLFELLTLHPYIPPGNFYEMLAASRAPPRRLAAPLRPEVGPELEAVLARALAPAPEDRFGSAAQFAAALRRAVAVDGRRHSGESLVGELVSRNLEATRTAAPVDLTVLLNSGLRSGRTEVFARRAAGDRGSLPPGIHLRPQTSRVPAGTGPASRPRSLPGERSVGRWLPAAMIAALLPVAVVAGMWFERRRQALEASPEAPALLVPALAPAPSEPRIEPMAAPAEVRPREVAPSRARPAPAPAGAIQGGSGPRPRQEVRPGPEPEGAVTDATPPAQERLAQLLRLVRAEQRRRTDAGEDASALEEALSEVQELRASGRLDDAAALVRLEAAARRFLPPSTQ